MLLDWIAARSGNGPLAAAAKKIEGAVDAALKDPAKRTADLGGSLGTQAFAKAVAAGLS
jgi:3-isopropylmalate dehydrogenase